MSFSNKYRSVFINSGVFFLIIIAGLVAFSIIENYRFVKDDTGNIIPFYDFIRLKSTFDMLHYVASNEWLGYQPRSFFLTWWIQILLIKLFGMQDLFGALTVYFAAFASIIHASNGLLIFRLGKRYLSRGAAAFLLAALYLVLPTASIDYMVSNNWFFLLPLFFSLCFANLLIKGVPYGFLRYLMLVFLLFCTIFSGEQLMVIPFFLLLAASIFSFKYGELNRVQWKKLAIQNFSIILIGIALYIFYIRFYAYSPNIVNFSGSLTKNVLDIPSLLASNTMTVLINYTISTIAFILKFLNPNSGLYGSGTIRFSIQVLTLSFLTSASYILYLNRSLPEAERMKARIQVRYVFFFLVLFLSCMLPMYFGAISGNRPGPDDRYLMTPSLIIFALLIYLVQALMHFKYLAILISGVCILYMSMLTFHLNIDIWGNQKAIDMRLWSSIYEAMNKNAKFILTINNDTYFSHRGLQRPYLSAAWSDFQADWGVAPRIKYEFNKEIRLIHNVELTKQDGVIAVGYWGEKFSASREEIQVIYFNDGLSMSDAINGKISLMSFGDYQALLKNSNIPNRIIEVNNQK